MNSRWLSVYIIISTVVLNCWNSGFPRVILLKVKRGQGKSVVVSYVLHKTCHWKICRRCCSEYGKTRISRCTVKISWKTKRTRKSCCFIQLENPQKWTLLSLLPQFKEYWRNYLLNNSAWSTSESVNANVVFFFHDANGQMAPISHPPSWILMMPERAKFGMK